MEEIVTMVDNNLLIWSIQKIENIYYVYILVNGIYIKIEYSGTIEQCTEYIEEKIK